MLPCLTPEELSHIYTVIPKGTSKHGQVSTCKVSAIPHKQAWTSGTARANQSERRICALCYLHQELRCFGAMWNKLARADFCGVNKDPDP